MLKVLQVTSDLNGGGVSEVVLNITKALKGECVFDAITFVKTEEEHKARVDELFNEVFVVPRMKEAGFFGFQKAIDEVIKNNEYDVVHVHTDLFAWIVAKVAKKRKVKVIVGHAHGQEYISTLKSVVDKCKPVLQALNRKYFNYYVGCSKESIKHMFNADGQLIPNFVPCEKIVNMSNEEIDLLKREMNIGGEKVLGYLGRIDRKKNAIFLPSVVKNMPETRLLLAGCADDFTPIQEKIKELKVENKVDLLGFRTDADKLYNLFDVYVTASLTEGMSMSLIQSQMMGIPVVVYSKLPKINDLGLGLYFTVDEFEPTKWQEQIELALSKKGSVNKEQIRKIMDSNGTSENAIKCKLLAIYNGEGR